MRQQIPALPYQSGGGGTTAFAANGMCAEAPAQGDNPRALAEALREFLAGVA
jgi:hypothetical protein